MLKTLLRPPAFLVGLLLFAGCAASTSSSSPAPGDHVSGHITVLAAAFCLVGVLGCGNRGDC